MTLPLAMLWRHRSTVLLDYGFARTSDPPGKPQRPLTRIEFHAPGDAVVYLRFWKRDAGAMSALRTALSRYRQGPISRLSDDEVIDALAAHLAHGELIVAAERARIQPSAGREAAAVTGTQAPAAEELAVVSPAAPAAILPALEIVQIEGAEVLPEVMQTLEQLDLTMAQVDVATVSLEPAPSGVPAINTELQSASGSITSTLDDL